MKKVKLGEVCEIRIGKTPNRSQTLYWGGDYPWLSISDMKGKILCTTKEKITQEAVQKEKMQIVSKGTVVMSFKLSIGKVGILAENMYTNEAIANFVVKNNKMLFNEYLYYALQGMNFDSLTDRAVMGKTLNKAKLNNLSIVYNEPFMQQQIVLRLDGVNKLIESRKQQLSELSKLVKSRFNEMFEKNKRFESLDNLFDIIDGDRGKNYPKSDELFDEEYCLFLNTKNVTKNGFSFNIKQFITETKDKLLRKGKLERHDIVLTTRGTIGNVAYYDESISYDHLRINSGMVILRAKKTELNRQFILHVLKDDNYYKRLISGSAQPQLPITKIKKILLPLPPLSLQNEFADFVAQVDKSQFACGIVIKLWRNSLKSSII